MKLGIDIDGVLADFSSSFIQRMIDVTGVDKFPSRPFDVPVWNWWFHYGYTEDEVKSTWDSVKSDGTFWANLNPYPDAPQAVEELTKLWENLDEIYFITNRVGIKSKLQTEAWLINFGTGLLPTVIVSPEKGLCCRALKLDFYIDDNVENCEDVRDHSFTNCLMLAKTYNHDIPKVPRLPSILEFFNAIKQEQEWVN